MHSEQTLDRMIAAYESLTVEVKGMRSDIQHIAQNQALSDKHIREFLDERINGVQRENNEQNKRITDAHKRMDIHEDKINKINLKISYWAGGLSVICAVLSILVTFLLTYIK